MVLEWRFSSVSVIWFSFSNRDMYCSMFRFSGCRQYLTPSWRVEEFKKIKQSCVSINGSCIETANTKTGRPCQEFIEIIKWRSTDLSNTVGSEERGGIKNILIFRCSVCSDSILVVQSIIKTQVKGYFTKQHWNVFIIELSARRRAFGVKCIDADPWLTLVWTRVSTLKSWEEKFPRHSSMLDRCQQKIKIKMTETNAASHDTDQNTQKVRNQRLFN